jgi:hypothetical protein
VFRTDFFHHWQQSAASRHHDGTMTGAYQRLGDFDGGSFDATGLERRQ